MPRLSEYLNSANVKWLCTSIGVFSACIRAGLGMKCGESYSDNLSKEALRYARGTSAEFPASMLSENDGGAANVVNARPKLKLKPDCRTPKNSLVHTLNLVSLKQFPQI